MKSLNPKETFVNGNTARTHIELCATQEFKDALQTALSVFVMRQGRPETLERAWACQYELAGAKEFINILLNLADPVESEPPKRPSDNLNPVWPTPPHQSSRSPRQGKNQPPPPL